MTASFGRDDALNRLRGALIASCQPNPGPMDQDEIVVAMAAAAIAGGAGGLRIEGAERVRLTALRCAVPIIGIVKRDLHSSPVRISPWLEDIDALAQAGATVIAFDATDRIRPVSAQLLLERAQALGCLTMADCSTLAEAQAMADLGCDFVASTLSGYTGGPVPADPDIDLVRQMTKAGMRVIAEGRYNAPRLAADAIAAGAYAVTVGSAITRIEDITAWFCAEIGTARHGAGQ